MSLFEGNAREMFFSSCKQGVRRKSTYGGCVPTTVTLGSLSKQKEEKKKAKKKRKKKKKETYFTGNSLRSLVCGNVLNREDNARLKKRRLV